MRGRNYLLAKLTLLVLGKNGVSRFSVADSSKLKINN